MNEQRRLLKHFLAAIAYRTQKALRGAPESFADFCAGSNIRTPHELVWHMTGVLGYARTFFTGGKSPDLREMRHVLLVQPVMDYAALEPGAAAGDAIRNIAQSLGLDAPHGVSVRLTGPVPLADEEFGSLAQDAHLVLGAMLVALFGILWLAVRSVRVVLAIAVTTLTGLVLTAAVGLLVIGRFNLLSMAFVPLFVGLGVDFSIQFSVRALAKRLVQPTREAALAETAASIGRPLALSAAAIGAGFFAFLPTSYIGVAELGTIAGFGMIVAFALIVAIGHSVPLCEIGSCEPIGVSNACRRTNRRRLRIGTPTKVDESVNSAPFLAQRTNFGQVPTCDDKTSNRQR